MVHVTLVTGILTDSEGLGEDEINDEVHTGDVMNDGETSTDDVLSDSAEFPGGVRLV